MLLRNHEKTEKKIQIEKDLWTERKRKMNGGGRNLPHHSLSDKAGDDVEFPSCFTLVLSPWFSGYVLYNQWWFLIRGDVFAFQDGAKIPSWLPDFTFLDRVHRRVDWALELPSKVLRIWECSNNSVWETRLALWKQTTGSTPLHVKLVSV